MSKLRGNRTLTGTWGEIWVDGVLIAELSKIEVKVSANREDVQLDIDVDSKMTGIKGEFTLTIKKAYTRYNQVLESWKRALTCVARSSPSWPTRMPPTGSRNDTALTTAGTTICRWSTTRRAA